MKVEIGDRVRIKHTMFANDHMHHNGWEDHEHGPGWGNPIEVPAREHWEGARGVVVSTDTLNNEVIVRGKHKGQDFTLVLPESQVEILEQGVPR